MAYALMIEQKRLFRQSLIGKIFNRYFDVLSFVFVNLIIDIQPGLKLFLNIGKSVHGITHTLMGGVVVGLLSTCLVIMSKHFINSTYQRFNFKYSASPKSILLGSITGAWLHVFIDSIMHSDVKPFFPSDFNPLYQILPSDYLNLIALVLSLIMLEYLIIIIFRHANIRR